MAKKMMNFMIDDELRRELHSVAEELNHRLGLKVSVSEVARQALWRGLAELMRKHGT